MLQEYAGLAGGGDENDRNGGYSLWRVARTSFVFLSDAQRQLAAPGQP
jgi:hypothetical protein